MKLLTSKPVLGLLALVALVVVLVVLLSVGGDDDEAAKSSSGKVSAKDLRVGNCIADANSTQGDVTSFDAVPCDTRHDGEVFTIIALRGEKYPGTDAVNGQGQRGCRARLRRQITAKAFRDRQLGFKFVFPTKASWAQGDHEITCMATFKKPRARELERR